jgi:purine-cytosine permease-like protein
LFSVLSLGILSGKVPGAGQVVAHFTWAAFVTQLASAASFNVTAAPYVSDYSRYLPARTPRSAIILNVFAGSALSAIWLIVVGAWLATHMGVDDGLLALRRAGDALWHGLGSVLAGVSIAALMATVGMNAYSGMLTFVTTVDCLRPVTPTRTLRVIVILGLTLVWIAIAVGFGGNAVTYVNGMLVMMLYFLMPWTAVNLVDYFWLRRGRYSIPDLFQPQGLYGAWSARGLTAYAAGFAVSVPFFVIPNVYTGPLAARLSGVDIGWLVSAVAASGTYLLVSLRFDPADEAQASGRALRRELVDPT